MKRVNVRFVMIVVAVFVVSSGLVYLVHGYQTTRYAAFFSERAERAEAEGRIEDAVQNLNLYLGLAPDDIPAQTRLGSLLADAEQDYAAFSVLEKALRLQDDPKARRKLVDVLLRLQRWDDASAHLNDYLLKSAPDDPVLLDRLAQCLGPAQKYALAGNSLAKAIGRDPHQTDSYLRLIDLLENHREILQQEDGLPPDAEGRVRDADYWRNQMVEHNPLAISSFLTRAQNTLTEAESSAAAASNEGDLAEVQKDFSSARQDAEQALLRTREAADLLKQLQECVKTRTDLARGKDALAQIRSRVASIPLAESAMKYASQSLSGDGDEERLLKSLTAVEGLLRSVEVETLLLSAKASIGEARLAKGEEDAELIGASRDSLHMATKRNPQDPRPYLALAETELATGNRAAALRWLSQGMETLTERSNLPVNLARMQLEDGQIVEAKKTVAEMRKAEYPLPLVEYFDGRASFLEGNWQAAVDFFTKARTRAAESPDLAREVDYWLGRSYQEQGNEAEEIAAYRRALVVDPTFVAARLTLGDALCRQGREDQAMEQFLAASDGVPEAALKAVQAAVRRNSKLPASTRNWGAIESQLNEFAKSMPGTPGVPLLQANILAAQGRFQEAGSLLEAASSRMPKSVDLRCGLAELAQMQKDFVKAGKLLDEASLQLGDSVPLRLARGRLAVRRDAEKSAEEVRTLTVNTDQLSDSDQLLLKRGFIVLAAASGNGELALQLAQQVANSEQNNLDAWLQLLAIAVDQKNDPAANDAKCEIKRIEGFAGKEEGGPVWSYCQAVCLAAASDQASETAVTRAKRDKALEHVTRSLNARPAWGEALLLAASLEVQLDKTENAVAHYLAAIQGGYGGASAIRESIRLLWKLGRSAEATPLLERLEQQTDAVSLDTQRLRAYLSGQLEDFSAALPAARAVAQASTDYKDHLWLAQVCSAFAARLFRDGLAKDAETLRGEAEQALTRASVLAPDALETWGVRLQILMRNGRPDEVAKLLIDARARFIESPGVLADLCVEADRPEEAAAQFQLALMKTPNDAKLIRRAAEFCLRTDRALIEPMQVQRVATGEVNAEPDDARACRRALALVTSEQGGLPYLNAALGMIEENLKQAPESTLDQRTKAILLARHPAPERKLEAIALLLELSRVNSTGAEMSVRLLGDLYLATGNWEAAEPYLRNSTDLSSRVKYIQQLIDRDRLTEADGNLAAVDQAFPNEIGTAILHAEILFKRREFDKIQSVLSKMIEKHVEAQQASALFAAAVALSQFAREMESAQPGTIADQFTAEAEKYLRQRGELGANEHMDLVSFLATHGKQQEAVEIFEQRYDGASPEAVASGALGLASVSDKAISGRVEKVLQSALAKHGRPATLLRAYAQLLTHLGRWGDVEILLDEMIKGDPGDFAARNNLAEILALQGKRLDDASRLIKEAIEIVGLLPPVCDTRAMVGFAQKDYPTALADMRGVVEESPSATRYFHLAKIHDAMGNAVDARYAMKEAYDRGISESRVHELERSTFRRLASLYK